MAAHGPNDSLIASALAVSINAANTDVTVSVKASLYIVRRVIITNASVTLAASLATVGVFTGAGGTGTVVVTPAVLTGLTVSAKLSDMALALTSSTLAVSTLFIRNVIAHGSAATVDVYLFGDVCS